MPGFAPPMKALTVARRSAWKKGPVRRCPPTAEFALAVGEPAEFRFFNSAKRHGDAPER